MKDDEQTEQSGEDRPKSLNEARAFSRVTETAWPVLPRLWTAKFRELTGVDFKPEAMTCRVRVGKFPCPAGKLVVDAIEWHEPDRRVWIWQIDPPITIDRPECGGELMADGFWFYWDGLVFYRPHERARKIGGDVIERTLHERGWGKQSELPVRGPTEIDLCRKWTGEIPPGHSAIVEFDGDTWGICRVDVDKARQAHPMDLVELYQTTMTTHWGDEALHVSFSHRTFESALRKAELKELARSWRILFTFEQVVPQTFGEITGKIINEHFYRDPPFDPGAKVIVDEAKEIFGREDEPTDEDRLCRIKQLIPPGHGAYVVLRNDNTIIRNIYPGQVDESTPGSRLIRMQAGHADCYITLRQLAEKYAVVMSYLDEIDGRPWGEATVPPPMMPTINPGNYRTAYMNKWPWPSPIFDQTLEKIGREEGKLIEEIHRRGNELKNAISAGVVKDTWPATIKPDPEQNRKDIISRWLARIPSGRAAVVHDAKGGHGEWIFDPADLRYGAGQRLSLAPDRKVVLRVREGGPAMVEATLDLTLWELVENWDMVHPCDPLPPILPASDKTVVVPHEELRQIAQEAMAKAETPLKPLPPACTVDRIHVVGFGQFGRAALRCSECGVQWATCPEPRPIDVWRSATGHVDRSGVKVGS